MPEISRFLGIVIAMYDNDHAQPPVHARYGAAKVEIDIQTLARHAARRHRHEKGNLTDISG
ncbi:MAG: DUF4160 domain-containing protein [Thiocapsa sp.]|uniref:DUF4160 domain-containing protein n=1 Tax=Thiocapsa sp. TaxID=2024551 RepID=UPI001BCBDA5D|nr:DUF4160 domain-containing protein [Thiocapsa sp.]QVL50181.1 MAG: DUF4160 domain-containing protein [Thiocapsa sp.]